MNLFTIIVYYIVNIAKQLKFLNSHCYTVCSHWSVVSLITKMVECSGSLHENKIHMVGSLFNEDSKTLDFLPGRP